MMAGLFLLTHFHQFSLDARCSPIPDPALDPIFFSQIYYYKIIFAVNLQDPAVQNTGL